MLSSVFSKKDKMGFVFIAVFTRNPQKSVEKLVELFYNHDGR